MNILFVDIDVPYPLSSGGRRRTWNFIRSLSENNNIYLICRNGPSDWRKYNQLLLNIKEIWVCSNKKRIGYGQKFINFIEHIPWEISNVYSKIIEDKFIEILAEKNIQLVFFRYLPQAQYFFRNMEKIDRKKCKFIIDLDDLGVRKTDRLNKIKGYQSRYDKWRKSINLEFLSSYYKNMEYADKCFVCSYDDLEYVRENKWLNIKKINVMPNFVNLSEYSSIDNYSYKQFQQKKILFCGNLEYEANLDSLYWFLQKIFPKIKAKNNKARLFVVGSNPPNYVKKLNDLSSLSVFSNVESVLPFYNECSLVVVPLRIGGGTRIKILESLACKRPVVSTTIGAEGLNLRNDFNCIIKDSPEDFANACLFLLNSYDVCAGLSKRGFEFVANNYSFLRLKKCLAEIINDL